MTLAFPGQRLILVGHLYVVVEMAAVPVSDVERCPVPPWAPQMCHRNTSGTLSECWEHFQQFSFTDE